MKCPKMQITFTFEMLESLKKEAKKSGNSVSSIVRILVAEYLEKKGIEIRKKRTRKWKKKIL